MHRRPFVTEIFRTLTSVRTLACLFGTVASSLQAATFSMNHFGFGPINVETSLTILKTGSYLRATATNGTDEPIESMRLCVLAMAVKGCLFEMWTTKPLAPGEAVSWDLSSRILPPNTVHEMSVLSMERLSRPVLAQRTIEAAAPLLETRPAEARTLITRALKYDDVNAGAKDLSRTLEERSRQARQQLQMAQAAIRACNSQAAEEGLGLVTIWREFFPSEFKAIDEEIEALKTARTAQQHWSEHAADTLTLISQIEKSSNILSCAFAIAARIRGELTALQAAQTAEARRTSAERAATTKRILDDKAKRGNEGDLDAQQWLAYAYSTGDGAPTDLTEAAKWFRKAVDQNDAWAATGLARLYLRGQGVPLSIAEAAKLFTKAADQGAKDAQYAMAVLLQKGLGIPQDYVRAHMWANLAAAAGHTEALQLRDEIASLLPPDRLAAAQALAAAWVPRGGDSERTRAPNILELVSTGSGFAISKDGYIVTNHHVIEGCVAVRISDGTRQTVATVIASDETIDLALLKASHSFEIAPGIRERNPGLLEPVWAAGFPLNDVLFAFNITSGAVSSESGFRSDTTRLQHTAPTQHGNSGGPLLTRDGNIAGVVVEQLKATVAQNVNWAVKASILRSFLDSQHAPYSIGTLSSRPLEPAALAERARRFTVLLECWK